MQKSCQRTTTQIIAEEAAYFSDSGIYSVAVANPEQGAGASITFSEALQNEP